MNETAQLKYCNNCGTEMTGNFCHNCGQKKYSLDHFTVKHFIYNFFDSLFNWDSKFLRSMKALLFKPGLLTNEYISGRLEPYVMPLKLYVFIALVSFFVNPIFESQGILSQEFNDDDFISGYATIFMEIKDISYETLRDKVNNDVYNYFSFYFVFTIFLFSLPLKLFYILSKRFFVEHLVFSLHFFSFCLVIFTIGALLPAELEENAASILLIIQFIYLFFALKKVYNEKYLVCFAETIIMFIIYILCLLFLLFFAIAVTALLV